MPHSTNQGGGMENFLLIKFYIISQRQWLLHVSSKNKLEMRQLTVVYTIKKVNFSFPSKEKEDMFQNVLSQVAEQFSR